MTRLSDAGIVDLVWTEDEDGVYAEGNQHYEVDNNNELAIFRGDKCVKIHECTDLAAAFSIIISSEAVCIWNLKHSQTGNGYKITKQGWPTKDRI